MKEKNNGKPVTVRKPKLISKANLTKLRDAACPRCEEYSLEDVKGGEVFCGSCGCHISPKIFDQLVKG